MPILLKDTNALAASLKKPLTDQQRVAGYTNTGINQQLKIFLLGTTDEHSPLKRLRGQVDVLRKIWLIVCEEWWDLHILWHEPKQYRYRGVSMGITGYKLPDNLIFPKDHIPDISSIDTKELQREWDVPTQADHVYSGCPMMVIGKQMSFPPITSVPPNSYQGQVGDRLNINMMPFALNDPEETLPEWCHQYVPLIEKCREAMCDLPYLRSNYQGTLPFEVAYLTIDEREVPAGESHRRGGVHVESPIWPEKPYRFSDTLTVGFREVAPSSLYWGGGPVRASRVHGGIFVCSNVSDSTAVWNCQVFDYDGEVIRKHGNLEHCRSLLGAPSKVLEAGELVWMTDRTPHESLVLKEGTTRQFFRLVTGEVSAWFTAHNTPNPLAELLGDTFLEKDVQIIEGDKYALCKELSTRWECGTSLQVQQAKQFRALQKLLCIFELGHLAESCKLNGILSVQDFMDRWGTSRLWGKAKSKMTYATFERTCDHDMINYMIQTITSPAQLMSFEQFC